MRVWVPDQGAPGLMCTSKPEGGTAALLEPAYPTPPLPFLSLSLSFLPIAPSLARPSSVITAVLRRHASRFDHRTGRGEGGMQGGTEREREGEGGSTHGAAGRPG